MDYYPGVTETIISDGHIKSTCCRDNGKQEFLQFPCNTVDGSEIPNNHLGCFQSPACKVIVMGYLPYQLMNAGCLVTIVPVIIPMPGTFQVGQVCWAKTQNCFIR